MFRKAGLNTVLREYAWLLIFIMCASCTNTKKVTYFNGMKDGTISSQTPIPESLIQKGDILTITVSSLSAEASAPFNSGGGASAGSAAGGDGYLVNSDGFIHFPLIGLVKAEGLTKNQLKDNLTKTILDKQLLVDPIVSIRFANFRVTVLGEVQKPTVVAVPNEKISLLEAIGLAGDLTLYARRDNITIIREVKDQKIIKHINLNSDELFTSDYYYLKSNDIVYVEPNKTKVASTSRSQTWLPIFFSGLSLAALVADRIISK